MASTLSQQRSVASTQRTSPTTPVLNVRGSRCVAHANHNRRDVVQLMGAATLLLAPSVTLPAQASPAPSVSAAEFYQEWSYTGPADLVPYVLENSKAGVTEEVLNAIDTFSVYYPMYKIGPEKGRYVTPLVHAACRHAMCSMTGLHSVPFCCSTGAFCGIGFDASSGVFQLMVAW